MLSRKALGGLIKNVREKRKMTITDLARKSGVSRMAIYKQESGLVYMHIETLDLIFRALNYKFIIGGSNHV